MTRLRFTLKDRTVPDTAAVKKLNGVLGAQESGGQFQVIIGQNVPKVYDELCILGGFSKQAAIDENLDGPKEKLTMASVGKNIMNYLAGSMTPMIPVLLAAGLFKTIGVVFGPTMLGVMAADSDLVRFMDMIYNAAFYFMPSTLDLMLPSKSDSRRFSVRFRSMLIEPTSPHSLPKGQTLASTVSSHALLVPMRRPFCPVS